MEKHYLKHYRVVGRRRPTTEGEVTPVYRMNIFARNPTLAKGKFWTYLKGLKKIKATKGETLGVFLVSESSKVVARNYAVSIRYNSRSGTHNMYKEYRDVSLIGAVEQMYGEMASRHKARASSVHILKATTIPASKCKRTSTQQFHNSQMKFPVPRFQPRIPNASFKTNFRASRPTTA